MSLNTFGVFEFDAFHRPDGRGSPPNIIGEMSETLQRPGYDGTAIIKLGLKEDAFQMRSFVGTTSQLTAMMLFKLYKASQGTGPYSIVWGGLDFASAYEVMYVPLKVELVRAIKLSASAGGVYAPCYGALEAMWTLQPVRVPEGD